MQLSTSHLSEHVEVIDALITTAAGSSDANGNTIDMADAFGCMFILKLGTITDTAVGGLKVQQSEDDSTWADITSATQAHATTGDSNKMIIIDVRRPAITMRYVRAVVERATANSEIDQVMAIKYQMAGSVVQGTNASTTVIGTVNVP